MNIFGRVVTSLVLVALSASPSIAFEDSPIGFASVNALGQDGTTGGAGGPVVTVTDGERLSFYASRNTPYIIQVQGQLTAKSISVHSDKTIIGIGENPAIKGQIYVNDHNNVIIRNLSISGVEAGDGITIINKAHHVWVDHCSISDCTDGLCDISRASDYVTVSWCKFQYTDKTSPHRLTMLIGSGDGQVDDAGKLHVTVHHNWFGEGCLERMPSVRYGRVHVFNNYYSCAGNGYCVRSRLGAEVLVENNSFSKVADPHTVYVSKGDAKFKMPTGVMEAVGNAYDQTTGKQESNGKAFTPPYKWTPDKAGDVAKLVTAGAGAGKLPPKSAPDTPASK